MACEWYSGCGGRGAENLLFFRDGIIQICFSKFLARPNGHTASFASSIPSTFGTTQASLGRFIASSMLFRLILFRLSNFTMVGGASSVYRDLSSNGLLCSLSVYSASTVFSDA